MAYTGGELNLLNGKYGISAPKNSVPVMKLIKAHRPKSKDELYHLIQDHSETNCPCGISSKGSIEEFGKRLFDAQLIEWGVHKYSLRTCIQWEYDLFIIQSLKGNLIEKKAKETLQPILHVVGLNIHFAEGFVDEELRVDLLVSKNSSIICGIQVKPATYKKMREGVIFQNKKSNEKWGKPVFYLYYDDKEILINLDRTITDILQLIDQVYNENKNAVD